MLAIDFCRQVFALLPPSWEFPRNGAMIYLGLSMHASGQAQEAERLLLAEYESCSDKTSPYALDLMLPLCFNYLNSGQLEQSQADCAGDAPGGLTGESGNPEELGGLVSWRGVLSTE